MVDLRGLEHSESPGPGVGNPDADGCHPPSGRRASGR